MLVECRPTVRTNRLSLHAEVLSPPAHLAHILGHWGPDGNFGKSSENDFFIYTILWYWRNVLYVLPDNLVERVALGGSGAKSACCAPQGASSATERRPPMPCTTYWFWTARGVKPWTIWWIEITNCPPTNWYSTKQDYTQIHTEGTMKIGNPFLSFLS